MGKISEIEGRARRGVHGTQLAGGVRPQTGAHQETIDGQVFVPAAHQARQVGAGVQGHVGPEHLGAIRSVTAPRCIGRHGLHMGLGHLTAPQLAPVALRVLRQLGLAALRQLARGLDHPALGLRVLGLHQLGASAQKGRPVDPVLGLQANGRQLGREAARRFLMEPGRFRQGGQALRLALQGAPVGGTGWRGRSGGG